MSCRVVIRGRSDSQVMDPPTCASAAEERIGNGNGNVHGNGKSCGLRDLLLSERLAPLWGANQSRAPWAWLMTSRWARVSSRGGFYSTGCEIRRAGPDPLPEFEALIRYPLFRERT